MKECPAKLDCLGLCKYVRAYNQCLKESDPEIKCKVTT
jgi:hypothetical protein